MYRILVREGILVILEFSNPTTPVFKQVYNFYFKYLLPYIGKIISKNKNFYEYLNNSVLKFPEALKVVEMAEKTGFSNNICLKTLLKGVVDRLRWEFSG